jgi:hypothetical protein
LARTGTPQPRSTAQAFVDHLNAVLNRTVTDSRLSLIPLPHDEAAFDITRLVGGARAPLELRGSSLRLFVRQTIVVVDGHCRTESYSYRLQSDAFASSWLLRWEYFRSRPRPDYPYPLAHVHVNAVFEGGEEVDHLHLPTDRVPIELVIWISWRSGVLRRGRATGKGCSASRCMGFRSVEPTYDSLIS